MGNDSFIDTKEDLKGIRRCLRYIEEELVDKGYELAANMVGAADAALEQDLERLGAPHGATADSVEDNPTVAPTHASGRPDRPLN